ncbi:MAG: nuclear transport factor 2 family protein [Acidobacteriota bacterium]
MNIRKTALPLLALLWVGCKTSGGFDPIELDFSKKKSPPPAATATPAPVPAEAAAAPRTVSPAPAPADTRPSPPARPALTPAPAPVARVSAAPPTREGVAAETPDLMTRTRIDGYNRRDLELLIGLYSPDAQIYDPPDRLRDSGAAQIRQTYTRRFSATPDSKLEARDVVRQGPYVVSRETEKTGAGEGSTALVISEMRDGKIVRVWILR